MRRIRNILIVAVFMHCLFIQNSFIYAEHLIAGFSGTIFKNDVKVNSFYIDKYDKVYVSIIFSGGELEIVLYNSQNKRIDPSIAEKDSDIEYEKVEPNELALKSSYYIIKNPLPGEWKIEVSCLEAPKEGVNYGMEVSAEGGFIIESLVPKNASCNVGEELFVSARLGSAAYIKSIEIVANITKLGEKEILKTVSLYDDGSHSDGQKGDGVYANKFKVDLSPSARYLINFAAQGSTKDNNQFSREVVSMSPLEVRPVLPVHIIGVVSEETKDTEGDGFIDQIIINVKIKSEAESSIMLQGYLSNAKNEIIDNYVKGHLSDTFMLDKGIYDIPFIFETSRYFNHEFEGPFKFTANILLKLYEKGGLENLEVFPGAVLDKGYFTKAYKYTDFQHPYVYFTGKFNDKGLDIDGDNKYDILRFSAEVFLSFDGDYLAGATLKDKDGKDIYYATNKVHLEKGIQTVSLDFDGKEIVEKKSDGPYVINNFLIYKYIGTPKDIAVFSGREISSSPPRSATMFTGYTTGKYNSDDFRK